MSEPPTIASIALQVFGEHRTEPCGALEQINLRAAQAVIPAAVADVLPIPARRQCEVMFWRVTAIAWSSGFDVAELTNDIASCDAFHVSARVLSP